MAQGRKPNISRFPGDYSGKKDDPEEKHYEMASRLRPDDLLTDSELKVYDRIAPILAKLDRLKAHYIDALCEYCRVTRRLSDARKILDEEDWTYVTSGRNGEQYKSRPEVAQLNDDWRKWRSLTGSFGLAPAEDRAFNSGQLSVFSDDFESL